MFEPKGAFSGFSVKDLAETRAFYSDLLGLTVETEGSGLALRLPGGHSVFLYPKPDHEPASFTVLNLMVEDIDEAVDALAGKGVRFERYDNLAADQDERGILRGLRANQGPDIAWFEDPSGNVVSVLQEE